MFRLVLKKFLTNFIKVLSYKYGVNEDPQGEKENGNFNRC